MGGRVASGPGPQYLSHVLCGFVALSGGLMAEAGEGMSVGGFSDLHEIVLPELAKAPGP